MDNYFDATIGTIHNSSDDTAFPSPIGKRFKADNGSTFTIRAVENCYHNGDIVALYHSVDSIGNCYLIRASQMIDFVDG